MQRYFIDKTQLNNNKAIIVGEDVHHITKVMRSKIGDKVICSTGEGFDAVCQISVIESEQVVCDIVSDIGETREPIISITIAQGLPKADKMELIIQKGTEIGATAFLPFTSERTIVQLNDKKEQKKIERWQRIAKEAAEQAHRSIIPKVHSVISFKQLLQVDDYDLVLIAYEKEDTTGLFQIIQEHGKAKKILLIIGPEGGLAEKEVDAAIERGAISVTLGKRILRTETAGIVGLANIIYHYEEVIS